MTRRTARDGVDLYRVAVRRKVTIPNPDRKRPGQPWFLETGETAVDHYGPYDNRGAARRIRIHEAYLPYLEEDGTRKLRGDVIETWIEKVDFADIPWVRLEEG